MTATIPLHEPASFNAGDTVKWRISVPDYLPADGWVLSYALVQSTNQKTISGTNNGDGTHLATITAANSATYTAGIYFYQAYVTLSAERYKVREGRVEVKPNFAAATTGVDARSHVKTVLDALEATLANKASRDQLNYTINGTTIAKLTPADIIKWHSHYSTMYRQELAAENVAKGEALGNMIRVRF